MRQIPVFISNKAKFVQVKEMITYRTLTDNEICRDLFRHFIRHQVVTKCCRRENEQWVIRDDPFIDEWTEEEYQALIADLQETIRRGGFVYAAFCDGQLKGFASVASELFGTSQQYLDLTNIYVSEDQRNRQNSFCRCKDLGEGTRGQETVYFRSFGSRKPGILQKYGMRGSKRV